jgi:hypothetical protein
MTTSGKVTRVEVPARVLEARLLDRVEYADAFHASVPAETFEQLVAYGREVFGTFPWWVRGLMRVRDGIVRWLGLRTASEFPMSDTAEVPRVGGRLGVFSILRLEDDEIILGEEDKHLEFKVSLMRQREGEAGPGVVMTTLVEFNNWLGRAYFVPVRFFHVLIVRRMMRGAARRMTRRNARARAAADIGSGRKARGVGASGEPSAWTETRSGHEREESGGPDPRSER